MESGEGAWTHSGTHDMWRLEDHRQHSGTYSWYCGDNNYVYSNNTDAILWSPTFVVPEHAELSFWCYFDVTIYGTDGMYIEVLDDGDWMVVSYLGSGGALDPWLFMCDWAEHTHDLSFLAPGSTSQVRFHLVTDETDYDEGFYVDDVRIAGVGTTTTGVEENELPLAPAAWMLSPTAPNPVRRAASWSLSLASDRQVSARIYDSQGRLARRLVDRQLGAGQHELRWDGALANGQVAPAGVYFLRVTAGDDMQALRKVVRVRR